MCADLGPIMDRPTSMVEVQSFPRPPKSNNPDDEMIRKRTSWNGPPLRSDPFTSGHPDPLAYYPVFHGKHGDYIGHPDNTTAPIAATGSPLQEHNEPTLEPGPRGERHTVQSLGLPLSNPIRVDSLYPTNATAPEGENLESLSPFQQVDSAAPADASKTILTRIGMGKIFRSFSPVPKLESAKKPANLTLAISKPSMGSHLTAPAHATSSVDGSFQNFINYHEANLAEGVSETKGKGLERPLVSLRDEIPSSNLKEADSSVTPRVNLNSPMKHSSASGLPKGWTRNHDRLIAYLETHAKLNEHGLVPESLEDQERYEVSDMVALLREKFIIFKNIDISHAALSTRLRILELQNNNFFNVPYFWYQDHPWGRNI